MNKKTRKLLIWAFSILGIGTVIYIGYMAYFLLSFLSDCGMDDGPFKAVLISPIEISENAQKFTLSNNGELILENRNDSLSPILILIENDIVKWSLDTATQNTDGHENTRIWKISNLTVLKNTDPIEINFTGHWTYGAEAGSMKIDRKDGENSFCLSW